MKEISGSIWTDIQGPRGAGDERRIVRAQESDGLRDIRSGAEAAQRVKSNEPGSCAGPA